MVGGAALCADLAVAVLAPLDRRSERRRQLRLDHVRTERAASLRHWMNLPADHELDDVELEAWLAYGKVGLPADVAEEWFGYGYPPGVAAAAVCAGANRCDVDKLAAVMAKVGAYDGSDRNSLNELIGWHTDFDGAGVHDHPVLERWLPFPLPVIEQRVAGVVAAEHQAGQAATKAPGGPSLQLGLAAIPRRPGPIRDGARATTGAVEPATGTE